MPSLTRRRPSAALLSEVIKPIGKRRLEIRQRVSCPLVKQRLRYVVETWFFLPQSLQVNRWHYTPTDYQQSLKTYIRLGVPIRSLDSLLEPEDSEPLSPLIQCERALADLEEHDSPTTQEAYENSLKLFCLIFRTALRQHKHDILALKDRESRVQAATALAHTAVDCLKRFRNLEKRDQAIRSQLRIPAFVFCDEYLSIIVTRQLADILRELNPRGHNIRWIVACYNAQQAYRQHRYPDSIPTAHSDNELPVFRWGMLKKYVDMPLFLSAQRQSGDSLLEQLLYSASAAVAMSCALGLTFIWKDITVFSTPLFVIAVGAYMLRERIKDAFKGALLRLFRRWIPDRLLFICTEYGKHLGRCAEVFRFADWDSLPKDVRVLRNRTHFVDILNVFHNEDILYYSKAINMRALPDPFREGSSLLMDISRFDISDFLRHADDVLDGLPAGVEERPMAGVKVYHVDMVRKMVHACGTSLERFRIVLTHEGIRRIDVIESSYSEPSDTHDAPNNKGTALTPIQSPSPEQAEHAILNANKTI